MSNLSNIIDISHLITQLTGITNTYKLTNICKVLVRLSFEYIKKIDTTQVLIIPAYEHCIKLLSYMVNKQKKFEFAQDLIEEYTSTIIQLEKINLTNTNLYKTEDEENK